MDVTDLHDFWFTLRRAAQASEEVVDSALTEHGGLSLNWFLALRWLSRDPSDRLPVAQSALDAVIGLTPSGTSRMLAKIESAGLIRRTASESDRRSMVVELTHAGQEALRRSMPIFTEAVRSVLAQSPDEDVQQALRTLRRVGSESGSDDNGGPSEDLSLSGILTWHTVDAVAAADAMVIREALDPLIFIEAARFPSEEVISDLRVILTDMVRGIGSPGSFVDADVRFHTRMADMCQNTVLRTLYQDLIRRIASGLRYIDSAEASATGPYLQTRLKIHADLIDAISRGDTEAITHLAEDHRMKRMDLIPRDETSAADH